jgi:putative ABC transport system substrate-binding protein
MKRREFISLLGGAAAAWPLPAGAQQRRNLPLVGFFGVTTPSASKQRTAAFVQRLHELNWIDGYTIAIEYRWAEGRTERFAEIAAEFVRLNVDVIVTAGAGPVIAAKQATSNIPIVFAVASDPVATGLVAALARPGGNVTGMSYQGPDLATKRLELLREVIPGFRRLAVMANGSASGAMEEMREVQWGARTLGLDVVPLVVQRAEEIAPAYAKLQGRVDALLVCADPLVNTNRAQITALALTARLPTIFGERENVETGGLISYGPSIPDLYRRTAEHVDKILRGVKPADIPVEQPTKFELVINLSTAKQLGLTIPESFLLRADEVIE